MEAPLGGQSKDSNESCTVCSSGKPTTPLEALCFGPTSARKAPSGGEHTITHLDRMFCVQEFETELCQGLAHLSSELSHGLAELQQRLVNKLEAMLADMACHSADGAPLRVDVEVEDTYDGTDSGEHVCGFSLHDTRSSPLTIPYFKHPRCLEHCPPSLDLEKHFNCVETCADTSDMAAVRRSDINLPDTDPYTDAELELLANWRASRHGRWAVLVIGLLDFAEGDATVSIAEADDTFEVWEAWTTRTSCARPVYSHGQSVVYCGRGSALTHGNATDEPLHKPTSWWHQLLPRKCVIDPSNPLRFPWVCVGGWWVLMDCVTIPMQAVGLVGDYSMIIDRLMLVYWAVELVMSFFVGYYTPEGGVEDRLDIICKTYLQTWFPVDCLAVCGEIGMLLFIAPTEDQGEGTWTTLRLSQSVRLIRLVKLVRLRKLKVLLQDICQDIRTDWVILLLKIAEHLGSILMVNHYIACGWYGVAQFSAQSVSWTDVNDVDSHGSAHGYVLALHWSLSQFTPSTNNIAPQSTSERLFAIVVVVFAMVCFSSFVSGVTNAVNELRTVNMGMTSEAARLRSFLLRKKISADLGGRMFRFFQKNYRRTIRSREQDIAFFKHFPQSLLMAVHKELYMSTLRTIPVFHVWRTLDRMVSDKLCHGAFKEGWYHPLQDIFLHGDDSRKMFFAGESTLEYCTADGAGSTQHLNPAKHTWIAEVGLWIKWVHQGDLTAEKATSLVELDCSVARSLVVAHGGSFHAHLRMFVAFFVGHLEKERVRVTDLQLERDFQFVCATRAEGVWQRSLSLGLSRTPNSGALLHESIESTHRRSAWRLFH